MALSLDSSVARWLGSTLSMCLLLALAGCGGGASPGGGVCREGAPVACRCEDGRHGTGVCGVEGCDCPYALSAEPASLDFGEVGAGESREVAVAITNPAPRAVTLRSVEWLGAEPSAFALAGAIPASMPAAGAVSLAVRFNPSSPGSHVARLRVEAADPDVAPVEVIVSGRTPGPVLSCAPVEVAFENVWVGSRDTRTVICTNAGLAGASDEALLPLTRLEVAGPGFAATWREPPPDGGLAVGAAAVVEVAFEPAAAGDFPGTLTVGGEAGTATLSLFGFASELPDCDVEILPEELRWGVIPERPVDFEFAIRNRRPDAPCTVRDVRLCEGTDPAFSLPAGPYGEVVVPGGGELRFPVHFAPTLESCREEDGAGCVEFELSPSPEGHRSIPFACERAEEPLVLVAPSVLDFGAVRAGCATRDRELEVINTTSVPVHLDGFELEAGTSPAFFLRATPPAGMQVEPGRSAVLTLAYRPEADDSEDAGAVLVHVREQTEPSRAPLAGHAAEPARQVDSYVQCIRPKADVLVVIDNGTTMSAETSHVVDELGTLPDRLRWAGVDARLAVTTTGLVAGGPGCPGGANGGEDGRFFPVDGSRPRIVDETTPNLLATWQANLAVGTCHTAPPQALEAAIRALTPPLSTSADDPRHPQPDDGNLGFLRPDAYLFVIAVSDRADASPGTDDAYYQALLALKGGAANSYRLNFWAITGDRSTGCSGADGTAAVPGDRLIDFAHRTPGGEGLSICGDRWVDRLYLGGGSCPRTCFFLGNQPEDRNGNGVISDTEGELRVTVDGVEVPSNLDGATVWAYERSQIAVCFKPLAIPPEGSTIEIGYGVACLSW